MKKSFGQLLSSWSDNVFFEKQGENYTYSLTDPGFGEFISCFNGGYSEAKMMLMFQTIAELFFPINGIATRVKNGIYKLVDADGKEVENNDLWNIVKKQPNWQYTFDEFIWHAVADRLVTGNRYGYAFIPSTLPAKHKNIAFNSKNASIRLLPPHLTQIHMFPMRPSLLTTLSASDWVEYYSSSLGGQIDNIPPDYVTHDIYMKMGDMSDSLLGKGVSPFRTNEYNLTNLKETYIARWTIYNKRGALGAISSATSDAGGNVTWTPEEKEEVNKDFTQRHGFGRNKSPFVITSQPIKYLNFGVSIKDLEPFKETEADAAALCGTVNFPISLMPKGSESKFSNLDIAERNLYENVIFSEAESVCNFLTKVCRFDELGYKVVATFDHVTCLQDDAAKKAIAFKNNVEGSTILYDGGHITQNELRENIGSEPISGGDQFKIEEDTSNSDLPPQEDTTTVMGEEPKKSFIKRVAPTLFGVKHKRRKLNFFNNVTTQ